MSSKLFHTIVAFGIALGAVANVGCAAAQDDKQTSGEDALTAADTTTPAPTATATATNGGPSADSFCDATWPTTKGGKFRPPPACVDPTGACAGTRPHECVPETNGICAETYPGNYSVCAAGAWTCKSGQKAVDDCTCFAGDPACDPTAPAPAPTTSAPAPAPTNAW